jgi:hypothetical protein
MIPHPAALSNPCWRTVARMLGFDYNSLSLKFIIRFSPNSYSTSVRTGGCYDRS